jgi:hypothetical protein
MGIVRPMNKPEPPHSGINGLIVTRLVRCFCISVSVFAYFDFVRRFLPRWDGELRQWTIPSITRQL